MKRVLVAGGGISGLSLAYHLSKTQGLATTLVESSGRLGGTIRTDFRDGFLMEGGPDSFLSEKPAGVELALELGLEAELLDTRPQYRKACVARGRRIHEIPKGFYLIAPTDAGAFFRTPLLSWPGKLRAMAEPFVPARRLDEDESVGSFIRRRFGRELLDRIGQPMVAGIYTGDPESLSLRATFPKFAEWEKRYGSVVRGLVTQRSAQTARGPRYGLFLSFRRGMETLVQALVARLPSTAVHMARIDRLEKKPAGWTARLSNGATIEADAVCLTFGARYAAPLLEPVDPGLAALLREIRAESVAAVQLAFGPGAFSPEPSSVGLVVPAVEKRSITAVTFAGLKYEGRTPEGCHLARAYVGGAFGRGIFEKDDEAIVSAVLGDLRDLCGLRAEPLFSRVYRHPDAMVQYAVGHLDRVERIERALEAQRGLYLSGASYRGVGIPDCAAQAKKTAEAIAAYLASGDIRA